MNRLPHSVKSRGFTLIELIVVIAILGILAATAMPRFMNLQREARIAKISAARGSVLSASALVHATALVRGGISDTQVCPGTGFVADNNLDGIGTVCSENGVLDITYGYPTSLIALGDPRPGIVGAAGLTPMFSPGFSELKAEGYLVVPGLSTTFYLADAPGPENCGFSYTEPVALNAAPLISVLTTTGC